MRRVKTFIRKFFSLSRGETNGFIVLVPLMAIILFSEPLFRAFSPGRSNEVLPDNGKLDSLISSWEWEKKKADSAKVIVPKRFLFNPNQASADQFTSLGFSASLAQRIINYRLKGGSFRTKADLKKIYGMDSSLYKQLVPFIDLPEKIEKPAYAIKKSDTRLPSGVTHYDINLADTAQLKKIYGIGNVLSVRIIAFRDGLGGFVSIHQLGEVYGLDSAALKQLSEKVFVSSDFQPVVIDVNGASEKELAQHPYIKSRLAKAITAYRFQHGNFTTIEDLEKIALIDHETFGRIKPYLVLNKY